jgi:hypothetical protein
MNRVGFAIAAGALLVAGSAGAQTADSFRDAWFWGVKAGAVSVGTSETPREARPSFGAEWLVTRTAGALYLSADYTNVEMIGSVEDPTASNGRRLVRFNNLRRVGFAALAFPRTFGSLRPYGGVGLSLTVVARAEALTDTLNASTPSPAVHDRVDDARSRSAIQGIAGVQGQFGRLAPFAQMTFMPASARFLINDRSLQFFEAGVRYNFGSSIDRRARGR